MSASLHLQIKILNDKAQGFGCNDVLLSEEVSVTLGTEGLRGIGEANQVHKSRAFRHPSH